VCQQYFGLEQGTQTVDEYFFFLISNVNFIESAEGRNPRKNIYTKNSYEIYKEHICKNSSIVGISLR
jgi:hypothetical protein